MLAADEFGIGTRDERLPPDPNRFDPPHDILAAEEFAMPAGGERHEAPDQCRDPRRLIALLLVAALAVLVLLRRR